MVLWRGLAEIAEKYLSKGRQVYVEGRIRTRKWTDKDGNDRYTTEILGDNMTLLGGAGPNTGSAPTSDRSAPTVNQVNEPQGSSLDDIDDDLPF